MPFPLRQRGREAVEVVRQREEADAARAAAGNALVELLARDGALQERIPLVRVVPADHAAAVGSPAFSAFTIEYARPSRRVDAGRCRPCCSRRP